VKKHAIKVHFAKQYIGNLVKSHYIIMDMLHVVYTQEMALSEEKQLVAGIGRPQPMYQQRV
jgi:hypothetical protein